MKLLIHHHGVVYKDSEGLWVHSTMGKWISMLAKYFQYIGFLAHVSENKSPVQDTCITNENVILHSLGPPGIMWDKIQRTLRIRRICARLENKYDILLIRGITPRQHIIWNNIKVTTSKKYFLLVGSLYYNFTFSYIRTLSDAYQWFMERYRRIELKLMFKSGSLLVNAPNLKDEANEQLNIEAIFVPTNTISSKEFISFKVRNLNNPVRLLFCGRIEIKKGIIEAINSVDLLKKIGIKVQLDLIGPYVDDKFYKDAKSMIKKMNIHNQIIFHGRIPYGNKLFGYFQKSDLFILPSYTEGFPHVIWEAAANCCPVLATSVGGIPALFKYQKHGILIPPKNSQALADSIIKLVNDEQLRTTLVTNAYKLAQEFTVESCAKKLADVILS